MGKIVKVSKTVNYTVEETIRKVVSAIRELGFDLENVDTINGTVRFTKKLPLVTAGAAFNYQCVVFDIGDGSTMCTIQTIGYGPYEAPWTAWQDSIGLFINTRKYSKKILARL